MQFLKITLLALTFKVVDASIINVVPYDLVVDTSLKYTCDKPKATSIAVSDLLLENDNEALSSAVLVYKLYYDSRDKNKRSEGNRPFSGVVPSDQKDFSPRHILNYHPAYVVLHRCGGSGCCFNINEQCLTDEHTELFLEIGYVSQGFLLTTKLLARNDTSCKCVEH